MLTKNSQNVSYLSDKLGNPITLTWLAGSENSKFVPYFQVYAVCFDKEGKILVIREKSKWKIPGGTPEKGEDWKETLTREVLEEASVEIDFNSIELVGAQQVDYPNNPDTSEGELYYQLRCVARVKESYEPKADPDTGIMVEREFVEQKEVLDRIKWGNAGDSMFLACFSRIHTLLSLNS